MATRRPPRVYHRSQGKFHHGSSERHACFGRSPLLPCDWAPWGPFKESPAKDAKTPTAKTSGPAAPAATRNVRSPWSPRGESAFSLYNARRTRLSPHRVVCPSPSLGHAIELPIRVPCARAGNAWTCGQCRCLDGAVLTPDDLVARPTVEGVQSGSTVLDKAGSIPTPPMASKLVYLSDCLASPPRPIAR